MSKYIMQSAETAQDIQYRIHDVATLATSLSTLHVITIAELIGSEPVPKCYVYVSTEHALRIHYVSPIMVTHGNDGSYSWGIMKWSHLLNTIQTNTEFGDMLEEHAQARETSDIAVYDGVFSDGYNESVVDLQPRAKLLLASLGDVLTKHKARYQLLRSPLGQKFIYSGKRVVNLEIRISKEMTKLLQTSASPNFCVSAAFSHEGNNVIVMEHCGDTMFTWMSARRRHPATVQSILFQLTFSMVVMHKHDVAHGDMHLNNICLRNVKRIDELFVWGGKQYHVSGGIRPIIIDFSRSLTRGGVERDAMKAASRLKRYLVADGIKFAPVTADVLFDCMLMLDLYKLYSSVRGIINRFYKNEHLISHMVDSSSTPIVDKMLDDAKALVFLVKEAIKTTVKKKKSQLNGLLSSIRDEFSDMGDNAHCTTHDKWCSEESPSATHSVIYKV